MALESPSPELLIKRLTWSPDYILNSTISIRESIRSTELQRNLNSSILGSLDILPTEILHFVLNLLDFQSLSRFSRVCHRGKAIIESLPAYRNLTKHASAALIALSQTKLITFHSAALIHAALRSQNCTSCQNFAPFLFLLTCERCCYQCLCRDLSLRAITLQMARSCFGLSSKNLRQIPSMLSIPGTYSVQHTVTRQRRIRLVSLKQAKELGIFVHGSKEAIMNFVNIQNAGKLSYLQLHVFRWLKDMDSESESYHSYKSTSYANTTNDRFCGMASIGFPSLLQNGAIETGLWCFGCRRNFEEWYLTRKVNSITELLIPDSRPYETLQRLERQARSKSGFIEHVRDCKRAMNLYRTLEQQRSIRPSF